MEIQPQKHIVTGYFHEHQFALNGKYKKQYTDALKGQTTLALEGFGHQPDNNHNLAQWIREGKAPRRNELAIGTPEQKKDIHERLRVAAKSLVSEAFYADSSFKQSRRANTENEKIERMKCAALSMFIEGEINDPSDYKDMLYIWGDLVKAQALLDSKREEHMVAILQQKLKNTPQRKVLFPLGAQHIGGMNTLLKHDRNIKFRTLLEKPICLGFESGVSISYRLHRQPSPDLLARGLFEALIYIALQAYGVKIDSKETQYSAKKFAKNVTACLRPEEIQNILVTKGERTFSQFMAEVMEKAEAIKNQTGRRQLFYRGYRSDIIQRVKSSMQKAA